MKVREIMSSHVVRIGGEEPVEAAARALTHYNIGILPVCGPDGRLCGVVTDRDLVTRIMAPGRAADQVKVKEVMTGRVVTVSPEDHTLTAAGIMAREQVRRLPVVEKGKLCGMVSLADLAATENGSLDAADALMEITSNICKKD